jgi:hypothetical protein
MTHRSLLAACLLLAAVPASAQGDAAALSELQRFVNDGAPIVTVSSTGVRSTTRFTMAAVQGCTVLLTNDVTIGPIRTTIEASPDLSRLSPEVAVDGYGEEQTIELVTSNGQESVTGTMSVAGMKVPTLGRRVGVSVSRDRAPEAARLFTAAVSACGGQPASPDLMAQLAAERLRILGNDAETFPLKSRCLEAVAPLVPAGTTLQADSALLVTRRAQGAEIEVRGTLPESTGSHGFSCVLRRVGGNWAADAPRLNRRPRR